MAEYKLIYFNFRGRAEIVRWVFKQGNIPFTDERVNMDDWPEKKKTINGGKLPVLMVKDHQLPQSLAIARLGAKKSNLVPENDIEAAFVDSLNDTLYEATTEFYKIAFAENKTEAEKKKGINEEYLPKCAAPLLEKLNKRLTGREWFISDKMTWGDLHIAVYANELKFLQADILNKYPALKAHTDKIESLPKIKEWLEARPKTEF